MSNDIFERLRIPFDNNDVKWRVGATNKTKTKALMLAYIDSRNVMERLDSVVGETEWSDSYVVDDKGVKCSLSIRVGGEWVSHEDGATFTDVEGYKGAFSEAFKRAAVKFGIARHLYALGNTWVDLKNGKPVSYPKLPVTNSKVSSVGGEFPGKYAKKQTATETPKQKDITEIEEIPLDNLGVVRPEDLPPVEGESISVKERVAQNVAKTKGKVDYDNVPPVDATKVYDLPDPIENTLEQIGATEVNPKHSDGPPQTAGQSKMIGWLCSNMDKRVQDWEDEWVDEFGPRDTWKLLPKFAAIKFIDRLKTKAISVGAWKAR